MNEFFSRDKDLEEDSCTSIYWMIPWTGFLSVLGQYNRKIVACLINFAVNSYNCIEMVNFP